MLTRTLRERKAGAADNSILPTTLGPSPASALRPPLGNTSPAVCLSEQEPETPRWGAGLQGQDTRLSLSVTDFFELACLQPIRVIWVFTKTPQTSSGTREMDKGTVQLDKAKVCEPRGHDWFSTVPGRRAWGDACAGAPPARLPQTAVGRQGHRWLLRPTDWPCSTLGAWEERPSPPPEPTSRVTWRALYVCARGW